MNIEPFEIDLDGIGGLQMRRTSLAAHLIGTVLPTLPADVLTRIQRKALERRIEGVKRVKAEEGEEPWDWNPGDQLPADDGIVDALLGPGTFHLFLAETMVEELMGIEFTREHVPQMEAFFRFDARTRVEAEARLGILFACPWSDPGCDMIES
ncbi:MAG: hypothetical protein HYT87_12675 [Nitrospirae bacterium]|nr:hypothetical protein [Nitrospirota bacterium]